MNAIELITQRLALEEQLRANKKASQEESRKLRSRFKKLLKPYPFVNAGIYIGRPDAYMGCIKNWRVMLTIELYRDHYVDFNDSGDSNASFDSNIVDAKIVIESELYRLAHELDCEIKPDTGEFDHGRIQPNKYYLVKS